MKLTHQIAMAFLGLALVIAVSTGVSLHYLQGIGLCQLQFENEWHEYQRMVSVEDNLKELATEIYSWQAGMIPVTQLKLKAQKIAKSLSSWIEDEFDDEEQSSSLDEDQRETRVFTQARHAFVELIHVINLLPPQPTPVVSMTLIQSLTRLEKTTRPLRQEYFGNLQMNLTTVRKFHDQAQQGSIYAILITGLFVAGISIYSIGILHRQALKLMEQERQMASITLVKNLAHEIRNPLGVIKSAASVIAQRSNKDVASLADDITSEVVRVDGLLTDLLRLRRGTDESKILTNIAVLAAKTAELFTAKIQAAGLKLIVDNQAGDALCPCRPDAIKQVLMNVLLNAIEASPSKSVIEIRTALHHAEYLLQVCDSGHGISVKQKDKIFDLMYTTKPYGFGIGLTVVKNIVEDHGGRIDVAGHVPTGTTFTVFLPMKV